MKKFWPYILILATIVQFLAPFDFGGISKINKVEASNGIKINVYTEKNDTTITVYATAEFENTNWRTSGAGVIAILKDAKNETLVHEGVQLVPHFDADKDPLVSGAIGTGKLEKSDNNVVFKMVFSNLTPETNYNLSVIGVQDVLEWSSIFKNGAKILVNMGGVPGLISSIFVDGKDPFEGKTPNDTTLANPDPLLVTTRPKGSTTNETGGTMVAMNDDALLPACVWSDSGTWGGCVGRLFYWALFKPTSYIFALTGKLLDLTVGYSVQDTSYRSSFVVEGWKVVRDICNMFFIFVLLYIAFGTILKVHAVKTQEMIINVIIIGLLINFSLFATQVIIDTSNILTRVFYNSETIKVGTKNSDGTVTEKLGSQGEIQLSAALVSKINPQKLLLQAEKVQNLRTKQTVDESIVQKMGHVSATTFILVAILASIVNIVGLIVFLSVSLVFISRVIGLWLAMIFAPMAFFSYTVPQLQDMDMIGWKKWWPETLKMAFMAPVFVFMLYLIIKFLNTGLGLAVTDDTDGMNFILGIFLPFIFIMILLLRAKDIAKKMSGEIGATVMKLGSAVGGVALGAGLAAATGGASMLMRGTLGRLGSSIANSEKLKQLEAKGGIGGWGVSKLRNFGTATSKSSFDVRNTKIGGQMQSGMSKGLGTNVKWGKGKEGGYEKFRSDSIAKKQKRMEELEVGRNSGLKKKLEEKQLTLKALENDHSKDIHDLDGKIAAKRIDVDDANKEVLANKTPENEARAKKEAAALRDLLTQKSKISNGSFNEKSGKYNTTNGLITKTEYDLVTKEAKNHKELIEEKEGQLKTHKEEYDKKESSANNEITIKQGEVDKEFDIQRNNIQSEIDTLKKTSGPYGRSGEVQNAAKITEWENKLKEIDTQATTKKNEIEKNIMESLKTEKEAITNKEKEIEEMTKQYGAMQEKVDHVNKISDNGKNFGYSINELKFSEIPTAEHEIEHENNRRRVYKADSMSRGVEHFVNVLSGNGEREARYKILMGMKAPNISGSKSHPNDSSHGNGGGHHEEKKDDAHAKHEDKHDSHDKGGEHKH